MDKEVQKLLEEQRVCAWCLKRCENADHLFAHIIMRHGYRIEWEGP
jgi:hypothetical protein